MKDDKIDLLSFLIGGALGTLVFVLFAFCDAPIVFFVAGAFCGYVYSEKTR